MEQEATCLSLRRVLQITLTEHKFQLMLKDSSSVISSLSFGTTISRATSQTSFSVLTEVKNSSPHYNIHRLFLDGIDTHQGLDLA